MNRPLNAHSKRTVEDIKCLHQYYRDCLSRSFEFPESQRQTHNELIQWASLPTNTGISELAEYLLQRQPNLNTPNQHDIALRLMLFTILQANLASLPNNLFTDHILPSSLTNSIKYGLKRILSLHAHEAYFVNNVLLLYRINMIEDVLELSKTCPEIFGKYAILQAISGFIQTMLGNYTEAMQYLSPLAMHQTNRSLPLVGLSLMTCQYFLGQAPEWPLTFESLKSDTSDLPGLIAKLPPIEIIQPLPDSLTHPIIFVACNDAYFFQHALCLAYSIHDTNPGKVALHLHLYSPNKSVLAEIALLRKRLPNLTIGVSVEYGDVTIDPAVYYSSARFVRAYEILLYYRRDLCLMDADALVNTSWDIFAAHLDPYTELVLACPPIAPFWEQVTAGFLYCKATPTAEHYLARVSHFILKNMAQHNAILFMDQIALSACDEYFMKNELSVKRINCQLLMDASHSPQAFSWAVTSVKSGILRYDEARKKLIQKYNPLQQASTVDSQ